MPSQTPPEVAHYVEDNSGYYMFLWCLTEFINMVVTIYGRWISNFQSLPENDTDRYAVQSNSLLFKAVQFFCEYFVIIAAAGFMGEQLRDDYSTVKNSPFVANRLCLYVANILFWLSFSCWAGCYLCAKMKGKGSFLTCISYLIRIPTITLAAAIQSFFYPYFVTLILFFYCYDKEWTNKKLQRRKEVWQCADINSKNLRNWPVVAAFVAITIENQNEGSCGTGLYVVYFGMGRGILYDGVYTSRFLLPPLFIIMFVSSIALMLRVLPVTLTEITAPFLGEAGAVLLLISKVLQVSCSVVLYLVRIIAFRDLQLLVKLISESIELVEEFYRLTLLEAIVDFLMDASTRSDQLSQEMINLINTTLAEIKDKVASLKVDCAQRWEAVQIKVQLIWNRLEGYDFSGKIEKESGKETTMNELGDATGNQI